VPFSASHQLDDKQQEAKCRAAMRAFGAPYYVSLLEIDAGGMYDTQAEQMGKVFVSTELGGCGTTRVESIEIAKRGVDNFLIHAGILDGELQHGDEKPVCLEMTGTDAYLFSEHNGLIEPCVDLGDQVKKGDLMARIHNFERTAAPSYEVYAQCDGMVIARHVPSLVKMGDCLNVVAKIINEAEG
jgi:N-alpha-acetyl-L-2,4-diaminobutyrate deacetylase